MIVYSFISETRSHCIVQHGIKLVILLPQLPKCWIYRCVLCLDSQQGCVYVCVVYVFKVIVKFIWKSRKTRLAKTVLGKKYSKRNPRGSVVLNLWVLHLSYYITIHNGCNFMVGDTTT